MHLMFKGLVISSVLFSCTACSTLGDVGAGISNKLDEIQVASKRTDGYPRVSNTVKQGCVGGFAVGAAQAIVKKKRAEKVIRDGIIGSVLGCTIAVGLDRRRESFSSDAEHFDAEIADASSQNEEMQKLITHTQYLSQQGRNTLASLKIEQEKKLLEETEVNEAKIFARADLRWAKDELKTAQSNLEQRQAASELMESKGDSDRSNAMNEEINELKKYVDTLEKEVASLSSINDSISQLSV